MLDMYHAIWAGDISLETPCKLGKDWVAIKDIPDLNPILCERSIVVSQQIRMLKTPWVSLFCGALIIVGNWLQTEELILQIANGWSNVFLEGRWWSIIGSVYLHGSKIHFLSNLILLLFFGWIVETAIGSLRTCILMLSAVVCSSFFSWYFDASIPFIGASAIIFALWSAQITIGFCVHLPKKYQVWYGSWGLILLFVVFGLQYFSEGISHAVHFGGVITGVLCIMIYRIRLQMIFVMVLLGTLYGFFFAGFDSWNRKQIAVDGLHFSLPNDFVSIEAQGVFFWFHRNAPSGTVLSAWEQGGVPEVLDWWYEKKFSGDRNQCIHEEVCALYSEQEEVYLVFERYGQHTRWVGCVFPTYDRRWRSYCSAWLGNRKRGEPLVLRQAREKYESMRSKPYSIQNYAQKAEMYGEYRLADALYMELGEAYGKEHSLLYRINLRKQGYVSWDNMFLDDFDQNLRENK